MRSPRLFLGIFALALLMPLLLLACGGSDEPTDEPSSERATAAPTDLPDSERDTDEPKGMSSSGQTTPETTTPSAEPSPKPRATARPPLAETSLETDREALVALYNATNGENWNRNANWLSDAPLWEWDGVTISDYGRVSQLYFNARNLSGEIPAELGNLSGLYYLVLSNNDLSGEIPPELGNLSNLSHLELNGNKLSGEIPPELGSLSDLEYLDLTGNELSGCVPSSLKGQLRPFGLDGLPYCPPRATEAPPAATGSAQTDREALVAFYNATNGENWYNSYNWLSDAPLGEWYGVSTNDDGRVTALGLGDNDLSGEIPAELGSLSNLRDLRLNDNDLSGEIPAELGSLSNLTYLHLESNDLSGEIPAELGSLSNLTDLLLNDNYLSGEIPAELGNLSNLEFLYLSGNDLSGCVPSSLEDQVGSDLRDLSFC